VRFYSSVRVTDVVCDRGDARVRGLRLESSWQCSFALVWLLLFVFTVTGPRHWQASLPPSSSLSVFLPGVSSKVTKVHKSCSMK
jgi:hypothetical protein